MEQNVAAAKTGKAEKTINCRHYGIDLLRIVAMYMIVIIHVLGSGGVLNKEISMPGRVIDVYILALVYCCVNCYALISGFVGYEKNKYGHKFSGFIYLWIQAVFYGILITAVFDIFSLAEVGAGKYIRAALPVTSYQYWYFSAYAGVVLIAPYLNMLIDKFDKKTAFTSCIGLTAALSLGSMMGAVFGKDPFAIKNGYSFLWLAVLYFFGGVIKKYELHQRLKSKKLWLAVIFNCVIFTGLSKIVIRNINIRTSSYFIKESILFSYVSPTMLIMSLAFLLLFANIKVDGIMRKIVKFAAPATFGVYLIHVQQLIYNNYIVDRFEWAAKLPGILTPLVVLGISLAILIVCLIIDRLRIALFDLLRIRKLSQKTDTLLHKAADSICSKVFKTFEKEQNME